MVKLPKASKVWLDCNLRATWMTLVAKCLAPDQEMAFSASFKRMRGPCITFKK